MTNKSEMKSPVANELRSMGFVPVPRLWVTHGQMDMIRKMADIHADVISEVRDRHRKMSEDECQN